ncbi:MAG: hypothetical protein WC054_13255 [Candidatus Nanopelagicales bacterium]
MAAAIGIAAVGLSACNIAADAQNAVVTGNVSVAGASTDGSAERVGPDTLKLAQDRLAALTVEAKDAAVQRANMDTLIATLQESASCKHEAKSCEKKLTALTSERVRLDSRIDQLPRAITATTARISQLQARSW